MNIRELLNSLETIEHTTGNPVNSLDNMDIVPVEVDNVDHTESSTMMPPAIAKITKSCGCDYNCDCMTGDTDVGAAPDYEEEDTGEIGEIIRLAGMTPAVVVSTGGSEF